MTIASDGRILGIGRCDGPPDLPTAAILPRPINLHTHLELSDCETPIGAGLALPEWAPEVVGHRRQRGFDGTTGGVEESTAAGVGAVVDIVQAGKSTKESSPELHRIPCVECIGLSDERIQTSLAAAREFVRANPFAGISPHAPYSVHPDLLDGLVKISDLEQRVLTMHIAESPAERQLLETGTGPFKTMLERFGVWNPDAFGGRSILDLLAQLEDVHRIVIAHGNDLAEDEFRRLSGRNDACVAYCPRTHAFFGYGRHPVAEMLAAGVSVGLGTDSRASNPDLSIWNEVLFLTQNRKDLSPETLVRMVTQIPACALGIDTEFGAIKPGLDGNIFLVPLHRPDASEPYQALFG